MKFLRMFGPCAGVLALASLTSVCQGEPIGLGYEVAEPFRLFRNSSDFSYYLMRMKKNADEAADGGIYRYPDPLPNRIDTTWNQTEMRYADGYANQGESFVPTFKVRMRVAVPVEQDAVCHWQINDESAGRGSCDGYVLPRVVRSGDIVRMEIVGADSTRAPALPVTLQLRERLVVALGDSYLSGEGVPDANMKEVGIYDKPIWHPPVWWDHKCHRSLSAAAVYSTALLSEARPHEAFTLLSYACSGAEIGGAGVKEDRGGILSPYSGRETAKDLERMRDYWYARNSIPTPKSPVVPAQLSQLIEDLCPVPVDKSGIIYQCPSKMREVDVLLVGIGGNDVGFGRVIRESVAKNLKSADYVGVDRKMKEMPTLYRRLDQSLSNSGVRFANKVLMDYGNPTQKRGGEYCSDQENVLRPIGIPFLLSISKREFEMAKTRILDPLNRIGDEFVAANKSTWVRFRKTGELTDGLGICTRGRFTSMDQANAKQGVIWSMGFSSGVFHPNFLYHHYQGRELARTVGEVLDRTVEHQSTSSLAEQ